MVKSYLKIVFRNIRKNKIYVLINMLGMGIAIACCMTAYLLIAYNIEFDDYFEADRVEDIVKIVHHLQSSTGEKEKTLACPISLAPAAQQEIAGINAFTRFCNEDGILSYGDMAFYENVRFADSSFFNMFPIKLTKGSYENFKHIQYIFLSETLAKKYFKEKDPIGETMTVELNGEKLPVLVGGVLEKVPLNISFHIDALLRIENFLEVHSIEPGKWDLNETSATLFKLDSKKAGSLISQQMKKYSNLINQNQNEFHSMSFELVPFRKAIINGEVSRSHLRLPIPTIALLIFGVLAGIILLIACFNLTNTTLATMGKRLKEIAIRKVVGSRRSQIAFQFILEISVTVLLSIIAGVMIAQVIVPRFASMWQLQYELHDLNKLNFIIALLILLFIASLIAGIYPALTNSKHNPVDLFKGSKNSKGTTFLSRSLLLLQFSLSIIVAIAGIVFTQNAWYQNTIEMGYDKNNIITVSIHGEREYHGLKNNISGHSDVQSIAPAANHIGPYSARYHSVKIDTTAFKTNVFNVGVGYFSTVGLQVINGRDFIEGNQTDYESGAIVDENFVMNHGIKNPLNTRIFYNDKPYYIIGIAKNHLSGLKQKSNSEHLFTLASPDDYSTMIIRTQAGEIGAVHAYVEAVWKKIFPGRPIEIKRQEEIIHEEARTYNTNLSSILLFITVLGCLLSASGIYALANLNVQKRTKEIGIRKVLGASVQSILQLVNREFFVLLLLAALLGSVGGYTLTTALLDDLFAQHVEVSLLTLTLCSLTVFASGMLATSGTILNTARKNPTTSLRSE